MLATRLAEGRVMSLSALRRLLYALARFLGDVQPIRLRHAQRWVEPRRSGDSRARQRGDCVSITA